MTIASETRALIQAALDGEPALTTLTVTGSSPETMVVRIRPGIPAHAIGGCTYYPNPPFGRETVTELVARMQILRWQRAKPLSPLAMPPAETDLQTLHLKHGWGTVGIECGPGWTDLLDATLGWLKEIAPENHWAADQIREKYGTVHFDWHGGLPELGEAIISATEHLSGHLCEACGAPGSEQNWNGWWSTRCPDLQRRSSS